jgi:hypothetical protein
MSSKFYILTMCVNVHLQKPGFCCSLVNATKPKAEEMVHTLTKLLVYIIKELP